MSVRTVYEDLKAKLHDVVPDAELRLFSDARHGLPFSHAGAGARALRSFIGEDSIPQKA